MTEARRQEATSADHLVYAPRFGIELMTECDHAAVAAGVSPPAAQPLAKNTDASDLCVRCPRCSRMVDVRFWRPESGEWLMRLRDRFAAGHMSIFRYTGDRWISDG